MNAICAVSTDHTVPKWKHHYPRKAHKFKHSFSLISCLRMDQISWQYSCHLHNLNSDSSSWAVTFPAASCFSIHLSAHPYMSVCLWCVWFSQRHFCCHWCLYSAWCFYAAAIPATCLKKKAESSPTLQAEKACPRTESLILNVSTSMLQIY